MDLEQIRKNIVWYKGYKCTNDSEMKIIENSILNSVVTYFRPVVKDMRDVSTFSKTLEEEQREEEALQEFKEMKQVSKNFLINELVINFMSKAHNDWILAHKNELQNNTMKNPEKFVPFEMLTAKEIKDYMNVTTSIFKCLEISFDEKEVKKAFTRRQLIFMINKDMYSADNLTQKIMNTKEFNPEIIENSSSEDEKSIEELFANEEVANKIAEKVKQRINISISDKFIEVLKQNSDVGYFIIDKGDKIAKKRHVYKFTDNLSQKKIGFKKHAIPKLEKPITKAVYHIARFGGVVFAKNVKTSDYKYYDYTSNSYRFVEYKDCTDEQKRVIERRNRKLNKLLNKMDYSSEADNPGMISMVVVKKNYRLPRQDYLNTNNKYVRRETEVIQIPITQRELLEMRILPEEVGWEKDKKARIFSNNKVFLASKVKRLPEKNDFKESLVLVNKSINSNESKESIKKTTEHDIEK